MNKEFKKYTQKILLIPDSVYDNLNHQHIDQHIQNMKRLQKYNNKKTRPQQHILNTFYNHDSTNNSLETTEHCSIQISKIFYNIYMFIK
ncbi:hypothetical protein AB837_00384 [bacterium AB1]|nr:hypothetical protein AB837_00384 [bacterium AB1]